MFSALLPKLISLTSVTGEAIMSLQNKSADFIVKSDSTPLTQADNTSHNLITDALDKITPDIPILSEESKETSFSVRKKWQKYWLIDPLDGTRDFIEGSNEFCINIAFIENNYPVFGLIYSPYMKTHYYRLPQQESIKLIDNVAQKLCTKKPKRWEKIVFGRYSQNNKQLQQYLRSKTNFETFRLGSALKFCFIAEGIYHYYPKFGKCSEWDTAAGVCILEGAGGKVLDLQGQPLKYNTKEDAISPKFIASA
ncbi:MAG: 3'(2'),5'-bisphosphate nucleotidase CysQ [Gammaproteobacteria bacterium]|jgi:3'(2'), 5'-bisphosphate nucleotidase|nr:3'(2'),5'-bisphosphate nucleotidase CysQ [Gammaproteobacteria bacterium]|tara:strand:- start:99 stop:854 length:756 start_codon:yes stop_codon:yes gene_type:complete